MLLRRAGERLPVPFGIWGLEFPRRGLVPLAAEEVARRASGEEPAQVRLPGHAGEEGGEAEGHEDGNPDGHGHGDGEEDYAQVGAQHGERPAQGEDGPRGADGRRGGMQVEQHVEDAPRQPAREVDEPEAPHPQELQHGRAEEVEGQHVEEDVHDLLVRKHAGEEGPGLGGDRGRGEPQVADEVGTEIDGDEDDDVDTDDEQD